MSTLSGWGSRSGNTSGNTQTKINFSTTLNDTAIQPAPKIQGKMNYQNMGYLGKKPLSRLERLEGEQIGYPNNAVFDDLINVILNAKKDITRINGLDDYETAAKYATKHKYRISAKDADINHDGINDIVLYNKKGEPVIVNGYKLSNSKQGIRKAYQGAKRRKELRNPEAGYRGWVRQIYGVGDWNDDGTRTVEYDKNNLPPELVDLKANHWSIPNPPAKEKSIHQKIMTMISEGYEDVVNDVTNNDAKKYLRGMIPRFKVVTIAYIAGIDNAIWEYALTEAQRQKIKNDVEEVNKLSSTELGDDYDPITIYDGFKAFKSRNKGLINQFLKDNWENICSMNYTDAISNIFDQLGINRETVAVFPTEEKIRREGTAETDAKLAENKHKFKLAWNAAADRYRNEVIDQFK